MCVCVWWVFFNVFGFVCRYFVWLVFCFVGFFWGGGSGGLLGFGVDFFVVLGFLWFSFWLP